MCSLHPLLLSPLPIHRCCHLFCHGTMPIVAIGEHELTFEAHSTHDLNDTELLWDIRDPHSPATTAAPPASATLAAHLAGPDPHSPATTAAPPASATLAAHPTSLGPHNPAATWKGLEESLPPRCENLPPGCEQDDASKGLEPTATPAALGHFPEHAIATRCVTEHAITFRCHGHADSPAITRPRSPESSPVTRAPGVIRDDSAPGARHDSTPHNETPLAPRNTPLAPREIPHTT